MTGLGGVDNRQNINANIENGSQKRKQLDEQFPMQSAKIKCAGLMLVGIAVLHFTFTHTTQVMPEICD